MTNEQIKKITKLKNIIDNGFWEISEQLEAIQSDMDNAMSHLVIAENSFDELNNLLADIVEGDKNA
jgi:hypothetical protein